MPRLQVKTFATPDEVRTFPKGEAAVVNLDEATIGRSTWSPGWRWSTDLGPIMGTRSCQVHHLGHCVSGVLRVRMECGKTLLTFKGPVQASPMKLREELETVVGDGVLFLRVLEELGFCVWFRYQKYREEFAHEDVTVALDETPVGTFVEIEGSERGIHEMAAALARRPADYVLDSYRGLFVKHCERLGLPVTDMLFEES